MSDVSSTEFEQFCQYDWFDSTYFILEIDITTKDVENAHKIFEYYIDSVENYGLDYKQKIYDMYTDSGFLYGTYRTIKYLVEHGSTVFQYVLSYEGEFSFSELYGVPAITSSP